MLKDRVTLQHEMIRKQDELIQEKHEKQILVSFNIISLKWSVYVYQSIFALPLSSILPYSNYPANFLLPSIPTLILIVVNSFLLIGKAQFSSKSFKTKGASYTATKR